MTKIDHKYYLFGIALFLFQVIGYNVISLALLVVSVVPIISVDTLISRIKIVPLYTTFLLLSLNIGFYHILSEGINSWNIPYWVQFYFFSIVLLAIKDKKIAFQVLKYCVIAVFVADMFTNALQFIGVNTPWSEIPPIRPGETLPRYGGLKGNALYSGSITFIAICILLENRRSSKWVRYILLTGCMFNIVLSGSFRYFIICAAVLTLYLFKLYKHRLMLFGMYVGSIIIVYFSTKFTMFLSQSNFFRFMIWDYYIGAIAKEPLWGHGYWNMHLDDLGQYSYQSLIANGVTESCILLVGYCFGFLILLVYLASMAKTLYRFKSYPRYSTELGIFLGLTLDLFWGGSFDNALSLCVLMLSWYIINDNAFFFMNGNGE